ncbi:glutathione synthase [Wenzhouxiangella marina]|uniref:Glutathione synthetase n=1 Tax=Wenzhouxiangella marina TaxID=1579979 RepID=A0A0K0XSW3_9GAMM|nr:glutathione synthase [Wenzhouxiangella marina]AKS40750.1 Glutathione synthetase [Wenzhouxiangella marina]
MRKNLIVVMDDISLIKIAKDTSFAMLLEGRRRGYALFYMNEDGLSLAGGEARAAMRPVRVREDAEDWFTLGAEVERGLGPDDLVLMRSDPPVDADYVFATYLLEQAERQGALVVNRPQALRDFNEKLAIARFPDLMPATRVSARSADLKRFVHEQGRAVLKPLDGMGGRSIFLTRADDPNLNVILETLTDGGRHLAIAQQFLPEIDQGDKRILIVNGRPVPYLLARIPTGDDFRGNLAKGGRGEGRPLSDSDRRIAETVGPVLLEHGIVFAGLDVIGERLTEINVTSPTCVRELDAEFGLNIIGDLFDAIDP